MGFPAASRLHQGSIHGQTSGQLLPGRPGMGRERGVESRTAETVREVAGGKEGRTLSLEVEISRDHGYVKEPVRSPSARMH